jgi:hypothetical protein
MKFGRRRPMPGAPKFRLKNYLRAALPTAPTSVDYTSPAASVLANVYKNDVLGDCVVAGAYHVVGVESGNAGDLFTATDAQILADYSAIGGYVPGQPSTDQGCDEQTALNYWTSTGFANGTKLLGYLAVDPSNLPEVQAACWLFENLYFGVELPNAWINPFPSSSGFTWDAAGEPVPENGHCFIGAGYSTSGVIIDTWGMLGTLTWAAVQKYCAQSAGGALYVMLSPDQLAKGSAKAPNGVAWADLLSDFDSIGGHVPVPVPAPAPPTGPATLANAQAWAAAGINAGAPLQTRDQAIAAANAALAKGWPSS